MKRQMTFQRTLLEANKSHRVPLAKEVNIAADRDGFQQIKPPGDGIKRRMGKPTVILGFDIETHAWPKEEDKGNVGQFGWYTLKDDATLTFARIVELGWVGGPAESEENEYSKAFLIKPDGFEISKAAADYHKITNAMAMEEGRELTDVLQEFMQDVLDTCLRGGRVVAHQIEFDAGIIFQELGRCGLSELQAKWARIARINNGTSFCTMDPWVGRWIWEEMGRDPGPKTKMHARGLSCVAADLIPGWKGMKANGAHHRAEFDAKITKQLYHIMLKRAHAFTDATWPRDNNQESLPSVDAEHKNIGFQIADENTQPYDLDDVSAHFKDIEDLDGVDAKVEPKTARAQWERRCSRTLSLPGARAMEEDDES